MPYKDSSKKAKYMKHYERRKRLGWGKILIQVLGQRCKQCGSTADLELDHIIPLSQGGRDNADNIQVLCQKCHRKKTGDEMGALELARPAGPWPRKEGKGRITSMVFCERCRIYVPYKVWRKDHQHQ